MKYDVTLKDIEKIITGKDRFCDDFKVEMKRDGDSIKIHIERMYEYYPLTFKMLMDLAEIFGTKNINEDRYASSGCETCDYGSCYEINLTIRPETENGKEHA